MALEGRVDEAREVAEDYFRAWTSGDSVAARAFLARDFQYRSSIAGFDEAEPFINFMIEMRQGLATVILLDTVADGNDAFLLFDCATGTARRSTRTAEYLRVEKGRITQIISVSDAREWAP